MKKFIGFILVSPFLLAGTALTFFTAVSFGIIGLPFFIGACLIDGDSIVDFYSELIFDFGLWPLREFFNR